MPARNALKDDVTDSYYHIYSRGVNRSVIFREEKDYVVFLSLLKRYLSKKQAKDKNGSVYPHFYNHIELLAFCLMKNHFHLLVYQVEREAMQKLMRGVMTSYSMYFNRKYHRTGPLFEGRYRATMITDETYLTHISRYIHLNPPDWRSYHYTSLSHYLEFTSSEWVVPGRILDLFSSKNEYWAFLADYEDHEKHLKLIKHTLANI